ncbi:Major facilitator superfamily protein [Arabidopsis thaliana]|uniref:Major facilitator superfamily protein n=1 Tax=Arabidopsis thaliana TaxID=3702 RepID=F4J661_ARATH|nr:Major facilitator superfamily protein [Arabidopsis thaliana]NP_001189811.1 Major facilitator superfamily protein [Arabidopsis thaliana]AEE74198.1 Major facilitator superfamily protein [Arabidopsis thaliana]AEE74199.1 Major facilitator superfamily protein [Arabidopsis thaliana]|eukprot:NP_001154590.1 Major facilitator superfamily protein [Arabidopsis thaliana]
MVVEEENRSMEEGLLQHQNDRDDRRITACVILSTFVAVCSAFSYGCAAGYTSGAETAIMKELDLSMAQFSAFGSFLNVGGAVGALFSGQLAVILGRRRTLWACDFFCVFGWLSIAFAKNVFWLDLGRISLGIGVGLISYVVPVYIAEITPKHVRGAFTASNQLLQNSGVSLIYFFGTVINWRVMAVIGAIPCILQTIGIFFIPESPRWLAKIRLSKEVESSLHRLRGKDTDVSGEAAEIQVMTKMLEEDSKSSFSDMFQKKYRRTLVVGIGLMLIQQLSGASGITYYSNAIFRKAGFSERLGSMIFGVFVIPKALVGLILVDRWGRRPLLLASAVGMSIGSLLIGVSFTLQQMNVLPELIPIFVFVNILVYFGCFAFGIGGLPWVIMSEIFPINIKVSAGTIVALTSWTSGWSLKEEFSPPKKRKCTLIIHCLDKRKIGQTSHKNRKLDKLTQKLMYMSKNLKSLFT